MQSDWCQQGSEGECQVGLASGIIPDSQLNLCIATLSAGCESDLTSDPSLKSGRTVYDAKAGACCIKQLVGMPYLTLVGVVNNRVNSACNQTLKGTVAVGKACYGYGECAGTALCDLTTCPGTCKPSAPMGSSCSLSNNVCAPKLECVAGTCQARLCLNSPCGKSTDPRCADGLTCMGTDTKTCQPPPKLGEACDQTTVACDLYRAAKWAKCARARRSR